MRKSFRYAGLITFVILVFCMPVNTLAFEQAESSGGWEMSLTPYAWLAGINGDSTVKGRKSSTDADFPDIFANLDFAGMLHFEARKIKWTLFADAVYLDLSADAEVGRFEPELGIQAAVVEFGGMYRLINRPVGRRVGSSLFVELLAGGRYINMKSDIDFENLPDVDKSKNWVDPFIGGRAIVDLAGNSVILCRLDFGGFGIGEASDFTWNALAAWGYDVTDSIRVWLGYHALGIDYETGKDPDDLKVDLQISGPVAGVGFRF
jgi:hypothetical protein